MATMDKNNMDTTNIISTIAGKPATGIIISGFTTISVWIGLITPFLGFFILLAGASAAIYAFIVNRNNKKHSVHQLKMDRLEDARNTEEFKKYGIK